VVKFIFKRIVYGILVMLGVTTVVFFLFNVLPGDPARMMLGQNASQEQIDAINKDLGRDKPLSTQFMMYINDLSPISIHNITDPDHYLFLNPKKYSGVKLFNVSSTKAICLKYPYLRRSYITKRKVSEIIVDKLPSTFVLAVASIVLASCFGIFIGIICALRKNSLFDRSALVFAVLGMAGPSFFVGIIIAMMFGYFWAKEFPFPLLLIVIYFVFTAYSFITAYSKRDDTFEQNKIKDFILGALWKALPASVIVWFVIYFLNKFFAMPFPLIDAYISLPGTNLNNQGGLFYVDDFGNERLQLKNLILPAITLGIRPLAIVIQLTRNSFLDVLSQDYIRTARAKGLSYYTIIIKHALKNALNPVITAISGWFAGLMAGAVFVEQIFDWKGIGSEIVEALFKQDLPVLMGCVLVAGAVFVIINIIVDLVYGILDPRVRVQ
jgi:ABC-type dipeptide/oligopeptide/nickel transport system permease component